MNVFLPNYKTYADSVYNQPSGFPQLNNAGGFSPLPLATTQRFSGDTFQTQNLSNDQKMRILFNVLFRLLEMNENNHGEEVNGNFKVSGKSPEFARKVASISKDINCNPKDLVALMKAESGLNSKAKNPNSSASGLIQFMDATAKDLGTTTAALRAMPAEKQLDYVEKYLIKAKKGAKIPDGQRLDAGTLYALVFMPSLARGGSCVAGSSGYEANRGLDVNKDGRITVADLGKRLEKFA